MELTDEQIEIVKDWVRSGESLATVQNRLREDFKVAMTYMDVRFLGDDLNVVSEVVETPEVEESTEAGADAVAEEAEVLEPELGVRVEVDAIKRPGALLSGTVVFSDGKNMSWQLDASGQLGLLPGEDPEYRPSPEDVQAFQAELAQVVQSQGY
ncbi:MAG: hypothetical protein GWO81_07675 [Verrucomicrobia bacterium]|nr:hypothetical protein [Verrucomicrobiota bacterium]